MHVNGDTFTLTMPLADRGGGVHFLQTIFKTLNDCACLCDFIGLDSCESCRKFINSLIQVINLQPSCQHEKKSLQYNISLSFIFY